MSPEAAQWKWARIKEDKRQRKEDWICIQFARQPQPMTVITPEDIQGDDGQGAAESSQRDKTMDEGRIEPSKLLERKWEEEIQVWQEDKQKIEAKYAVGEWKGKRIVKRFINMEKWCAKRPTGAVVDPSNIPWPIFRRLQVITPEDVNVTEVEFFLEMLRSFQEEDFVVHLKDMRIRFHPDKWRRSWKKIKDDTERGIWENAMLTVSQVVSAQYDFYVKQDN